MNYSTFRIIWDEILLTAHFSPHQVYLHAGDVFGFHTIINFRWIWGFRISALFATTKDDMLQQIKDQEVSNVIRTQLSRHPWNIVKEINSSADRSPLIDFGLCMYGFCGKMVMGFEKANHEQENKAGKAWSGRR